MLKDVAMGRAGGAGAAGAGGKLAGARGGLPEGMKLEDLVGQTYRCGIIVKQLLFVISFVIIHIGRQD